MILNVEERELFAKGHRACSGCGCALTMRHVMKAAGPDTIIAHGTGCMEVVSSPYPYSSWKVPWIHCAFENASAVASGVYRALKKKGDKKTKVLVIGGDGGTYDIGFQALSGAVERGENICYVCYDNGAYMNTGIQRSAATPKYAGTTTSPAGKKIPGKMEWKKPLPFIIAAHKGAYVADTSIAFPQDVNMKVKKGLAFNGPAFIRVFAPCPLGWRSDPAKSVHIAKLAVETGISPMYEIEDGKIKITKKTDLKPVREYLTTMGRYKHLDSKKIQEIQEHVNAQWTKLQNLENVDIF